MPKQKEQMALDLARALKRYNGMDDPAEAYTALHDEWLPVIARMIDKILWAEIKQCSEKQIVADIMALQEKAARQSAAVQAFIRKGMDAKKALDTVMTAEKRRRAAQGSSRRRS